MNYLKSIIGFLLIALLAITFSPADVSAQQRNNKGKRAKQAKQIKYNNKYYKRGTQVSTRPRNSVILKHQGSNYHYSRGVFYRPNNGNYIVTRPPVGIRVTTLPRNPLQIIFSNRTYYHFNGIFYLPLTNGGYEVTNAPIGARLNGLPEGCQAIQLENTVYYRLDETYYKAVVASNGNVVYEIVRI